MCARFTSGNCIGTIAVVLLSALTGCVPRRDISNRDRPPSPRPVAIRCTLDPFANAVVWARNLTDHRMEVELRGMAFAGNYGASGGRSIRIPGGMWEIFWTQKGIRLPARSEWHATIHAARADKLEVRSTDGRLLDDFNVLHNLPGRDPFAPVALSRNPAWRPPGPYHSLRAVTPADLPRGDDLRFVHVGVIGDVSADSLDTRQLQTLRDAVVMGRTLVVCGGSDLARLRGWERVGLLAVPVQGVRRLPGLRTMALRYGGGRTGPLDIADVSIGPSTRVLLEEGGIPLVVERRVGIGRLILVTLDPAASGFHPSSLERPFWQELWARDDRDLYGTWVGLDESHSYHAVRESAGIEPPSAIAIAAACAAYLALLAVALLRTRRRVPCLVAASVIGTLMVIVFAYAERGVGPRGTMAGLHIRGSGRYGGVCRGDADIMVPHGGITSFTAPAGNMEFWTTPRMDSTVKPDMRRWSPYRALITAPDRLAGTIDFHVELTGDSVYATVHNHMGRRLLEPIVVWDKIALVRLPDLAPLEQCRAKLATVAADGTCSGVLAPAPAEYGVLSGYGNSPDAYPRPLLLALCPGTRLPTILADGAPVAMTGHTAILVEADDFSAHGRFRLPAGASLAHVVADDRGPVDQFHQSNQPGTVAVSRWFGCVLAEFRPPAVPRAEDWRRLVLSVQRPATVGSLEALDCRAGKWTPLKLPQQDGRIDLPSPGRFVNRTTSVLLVRIRSSARRNWFVRPGNGFGMSLTGEGDAP